MEVAGIALLQNVLHLRHVVPGEDGFLEGRSPSQRVQVVSADRGRIADPLRERDGS